MEKLKSDLEWEVNNGEQLNNWLCVAKALVNTLNIKYAEVRIYILVLKEYFLNRLSLDLIRSLHNSALIVGLRKGSSLKLKFCTCRAAGPSGDSESWDISYFFIFSPNK